MSGTRWNDWSLSFAGAVSFGAGGAWNEYQYHGAPALETVIGWLFTSLVSAALLWGLFWLAEKRDQWFARRRP